MLSFSFFNIVSSLFFHLYNVNRSVTLTGSTLLCIYSKIKDMLGFHTFKDFQSYSAFRFISKIINIGQIFQFNIKD